MAVIRHAAGWSIVRSPYGHISPFLSYTTSWYVSRQQAGGEQVQRKEKEQVSERVREKRCKRRMVSREAKERREVVLHLPSFQTSRFQERGAGRRGRVEKRGMSIVIVTPSVVITITVTAITLPSPGTSALQ